MGLAGRISLLVSDDEGIFVPMLALRVRSLSIQGVLGYGGGGCGGGIGMMCWDAVEVCWRVRLGLELVL